jgi:mRNA interferase YafQ
VILEIVRKSRFKKDFKKLESSRKNLDELKTVIGLLQKSEKLDPTYHDHELKGQWKGKRDCHIQSNWLLIYEQTETELILYRTGSHSELFE